MSKILGWEKMSDMVWRSILTHKTVNIERYSPEKVFVSVRNMYGSEVYATKGTENKEIAKKQAIRYMRSHPNG